MTAVLMVMVMAAVLVRVLGVRERVVGPA